MVVLNSNGQSTTRPPAVDGIKVFANNDQSQNIEVKVASYNVAV